MAFFLGIDGGGTGCRAAVADQAGRILGRGAAGPANVRSDTDGTLANVLAATGQALTGTGIAPGDLVAVLGLAGANVTAAADRLASMLPFARTRIMGDGAIATRGALGQADGIVAAMGTGSVFTVQTGSEIRQVGGRGFMLGDEGSGAVLGRELLADVLRADDGLLPMTPLLAEVLAEFGAPEEIIAFSFRAPPVEFARFAPRMVDSDDPAALAIMARAGAQVRGIVNGLQPPGAALPVVWIGGLGPAYAGLIGAEWPMMTPAGSALDGAVQLAILLGQGG